MIQNINKTQTLSIVIVEDNNDTREALEQLFLNAEGYECINSFPSCEEVIKNIDSCYPDVVLMDINLEGMSGIEGIKVLKELYPNLTIIILTVFEDEDKILRAIREGADGYILKKSEPQDILQSVSDAYNGGSPITPSIAKKILNLISNDYKQKINFNLTKSEKETLKFLVKGFSYEKIAVEMGRSIHTVRSHIRNIYSKLYVHSKTEAVLKALKNKII